MRLLVTLLLFLTGCGSPLYEFVKGINDAGGKITSAIATVRECSASDLDGLEALFETLVSGLEADAPPFETEVAWPGGLRLALLVEGDDPITFATLPGALPDAPALSGSFQLTRNTDGTVHITEGGLTALRVACTRFRLRDIDIEFTPGSFAPTGTASLESDDSAAVSLSYILTATITFHGDRTGSIDGVITTPNSSQPLDFDIAW